jgi:molybdopterin/thiamine biosynthesis adenylyltransferase
MEALIQDRLEETEHHKDTYRPIFFNPSEPKGLSELTNFIKSNRNLFIFDEIKGQLRELIKSKNPKRKIKPEEYDELIQQQLGGKNMFEYGMWVYYPWSNRLVHVLGEEEYVYLRTAANRNKITTEEHKLLATKKVGVIGLSVGQSVAVTIAMERSVGELRLADFDTLELNNLNRIRTGVQNLGVKKVVSVAREIAEIDPYFKTVLYDEGIKEENIDDFFLKGGKLDLVIDECDGIDIKILCRIKARELNVPVLMEASDRGTLDVERYDLELDRPIMHGWLQHLKIDFKVLKSLKTSEEKLPYILPLSGLETLSPRMKASMVEIEQTLTTWPQLATAVTLGGAVTADTCRRIFLNQYTDSGRYFIDLELLVPDTRKKAEPNFEHNEQPITEDVMKQMAATAASVVDIKGGYEPGDEVVQKLVAAAIKAPSAGNNQPWKWYYEHGVIYLFHDRIRSVAFGDFEDIASHVALGAAIENLQLEANAEGISGDVTAFPVKGNRKLAAIIKLKKEKQSAGLYEPEKLVKYIDTRFTNRKMGTRVPIEKDKLRQLQEAAASVAGAELRIIDTEEGLEELANIMGASERLRLLHQEGHHEFYKRELRWTPEQSKATKDGIDLATVDISSSDVVGLQLVKDPEVVKLLVDWKGGRALENVARKSINAASAIGFITMPNFSPQDYLNGGRAVERMWLKATELDISIQPMLAATFHFIRLNQGKGEGMPDFMKEEFSLLYKRFETLFPHTKGKGEIFLFRLCIAEHPNVKSYRIPLKDVLSGIKNVE